MLILQQRNRWSDPASAFTCKSRHFCPVATSVASPPSVSAALFTKSSSRVAKWDSGFVGGLLGFRVLDDGFDAVQFLRGQLAVRRIHERGNGIGERSREERLHDALKRRLALRRARPRGYIDAPLPVRAVLQVSLLHQDAEQRADGGVARLIGEGGIDRRRGGFAAGEDDVHDLAFAPAEMVGTG